MGSVPWCNNFFHEKCLHIYTTNGVCKSHKTGGRVPPPPPPESRSIIKKIPPPPPAASLVDLAIPEGCEAVVQGNVCGKPSDEMSYIMTDKAFYDNPLINQEMPEETITLNSRRCEACLTRIFIKIPLNDASLPPKCKYCDKAAWGDESGWSYDRATQILETYHLDCKKRDKRRRLV